MVLVGAIHVILVLILVRAFAPDLAGSVTDTVRRTVLVTFVAQPEREPEPVRPLSPRPRPLPVAKQGAAAPAGKQARARPLAAPEPALVLAPTQAPPVAGEGAE
ncbi:energy transducer TonB, partial [Novosphingobium sp. 1949]|nr:energy transducer TonB [Novosphingobium organovorum]